MQQPQQCTGQLASAMSKHSDGAGLSLLHCAHGMLMISRDIDPACIIILSITVHYATHTAMWLSNTSGLQRRAGPALEQICIQYAVGKHIALSLFYCDTVQWLKLLQDAAFEHGSTATNTGAKLQHGAGVTPMVALPVPYHTAVHNDYAWFSLHAVVISNACNYSMLLLHCKCSLQ